MEIKFDSSLYSKSAVKKASFDYKNLADFFFQDKKDHIVVRVGNIKEKELIPFFKQEFSNYVLSLMGVLK